MLPIIILCLISSVCADNTTFKYPSDQFQTRTNRLITFNTDADDKIDIELDFSVPFLSIPVKPNKNGNNGKWPLANLNIGAVALAGLMAFGAAIVVPTTYHLFEKLGASKPEEYNYSNRYRNVETASTFWNVMTAVDKALTEYNIDTTSCTQRILCWTVNNANVKMHEGEASSTDKIIDGLATNSWVHQIVSGSVFHAAINSGLKGVNCSEEYSQCTVNEETIQRLGLKLAENFYLRK